MAVNKVILIGNVGKDPEVKYFDDNNAVANFSLATSERGFKAANGTEVPERTEWHNIVCWRALAERVEKYVRKGTQLFVEGKIRTREWMDQSEQKRYTVEILADSIQLLGKRSDSPGIQQTRAQDVQKPAYQAEEAQDEEPDDLPF